MRAGPLSNAQVVQLLNQFFVPVYTSNEDYRKEGTAPVEEKAAYQRIYREALRAKLSTGTVHAYVLTSDGRPIDSLHVAEAAKVEKLVTMLERTIDTQKLTRGQTIVPPAAQSACPKCAADELVIHITTRYLARKGSGLVPLGDEARLGDTRNASWHALPSENWVILSRSEWRKLLPPGKAVVGASWELDRDVTAKLLSHFYPQTENNDVSKNRIEEQSLKAEIVAKNAQLVRARLNGILKMKHPFYHKDDANRVDATLVGYVEFEPGLQGVRSVQLVTEKATYGSHPFGAALRSLPE